MSPAHRPGAPKLGIDLPPDVATIREMMKRIHFKDSDVHTAVLLYAEVLPFTDPANDELYTAWLESGSDELEALVAGQNRRPTQTEVEALFLLVRGEAEGFLDIADLYGDLFLSAFLRAPHVPSCGGAARVGGTVVEELEQDVRAFWDWWSR